ncbi:MAG: RNA polymerase sigma factor [Acidobacteriota bacterium]|nr:RNA polymerase sigma factor [Acidobacteriota bacterium]
MKGQGYKENDDIYTLVEKIKEGDREAFMAVTHLYQKKVYMLAYSYFQNTEDAMDIVQETFLRLYQKVNLFKKEKNFQNWLLQIAKNLCIDHYRKNYKRNKEWGWKEDIDEAHLIDYKELDCHRSKDLKLIISICLKKLPERQRMVFLMKHYNNLHYREIAQIMKIALGTVKSLHFKAAQNLRVLMSPYLEGGKNEGM